jgi:cytochrome c553
LAQVRNGLLVRVAAGVALLGLGSASLAGAQQSAEHKLAYGKHLSQECTTCHRVDGRTTPGIPPITGLEPDYFVTTMKFYQSGARDNQTMVSVAKTLNEEQLQALAVYFHSLKPPAKAKGKK